MKSTKLNPNQTNYFSILAELPVGDFTIRNGLYITKLLNGSFSVCETWRASSRPLNIKQAIYIILGR